ncbi:MAG: tRNA wybutosine-synthesizing 3 family protein [Candidatus Woesearchaeota archaeon]
MQQFEKEKNDFLRKTDKSRKGSVDMQVSKLVKLINSNESYYTTSSCAGRILLMEISKTGKKDDAKFIFAAHRKVAAKEILDALKAKTKNIVRLQQQNVILHIACKDLGSAAKILSAARDSGFMQSGIISLKNKVMAEIKNPEGISMIAKKGSKVLLDEEYLKIACVEMNEKLEGNYKRINKLHLALEKILS